MSESPHDFQPNPNPTPKSAEFEPFRVHFYINLTSPVVIVLK